MEINNLRDDSVRKAIQMNDDFQRFAAYLKVSDELLEQASKEEIAEVARVLALHAGHYRTRYGRVPISESQEKLRTETHVDLWTD